MKSYMRISILSLTALATLLTGCLKDEEYEDGEIQSVRSRGVQKIVEIGLTATSTSNFLPIALDLSNKDTTFNLVPVLLASSKSATEDIKVTLTPNAGLIGEANTNAGVSNELAPSDIYTIKNPAGASGGYVVTIPKGSNVGYLEITINPADFLGQAYALGFQISSIEPAGYTISTNLGGGVVGIGIKNKYDGVYEISETSSLVDMVNPALSSVPGDPYPFEVHLITISATKNVMFIPGLGYGHWIAGNSYYGEFSPIFEFGGDPNNATNPIVGVTNYYGDPSATRARSGELNTAPGSINMFNADRSIDVSYLMRQGGSIRTYFEEHFDYVGPRP
jgi:hypothetical protein